jgi:hypothetical protein
MTFLNPQQSQGYDACRWRDILWVGISQQLARISGLR